MKGELKVFTRRGGKGGEGRDRERERRGEGERERVLDCLSRREYRKKQWKRNCYIVVATGSRIHFSIPY